MQFADIAVVIPAHNAEATIGGVLTSIERQTLGPASVVVVDDGVVRRHGRDRGGPAGRRTASQAGAGLTHDHPNWTSSERFGAV